ncbi:hypothetical protein, conserved [Eimeria tenella]|uniref:CHCH domain-containing protein n=1 Tax=Eimeria tenella TaxID=5802 RepID=U6KWS9_EIMTE|nr:hypothetical protein, conserved [Eimeria tenella]CDJ41393.1 hypothetical protein, conserved [Eimeria tenella]|eukprot:XP_013232143.1 hypothetical protein, conserved [Eimeria tenella]
MSRDQQLQASCTSVYNDYKLCLSGSNRNPQKCQEFLPSLRSCEKSLKVSYCINETQNLMNCARKPDRSVCAKEFVLMRECNRPGGPQLLITSEGSGAPRYEIHPNHLHLFNSISADLGPAEAPKRDRKRMQSLIQEMKKEFNAKAFDFVPYKFESFRPNPGK